jgi:hypothetical protein
MTHTHLFLLSPTIFLDRKLFSTSDSGNRVYLIKETLSLCQLFLLFNQEIGNPEGNTEFLTVTNFRY